MQQQITFPQIQVMVGLDGIVIETYFFPYCFSEMRPC